MASPSKEWQFHQTFQRDSFSSSPFVLYRCPIGTLSLSAFIGIVAAFYFDSLHLALWWDLRAAKELGIISLTVFKGYPKSKDVVAYLSTLDFPILFSLSLWLPWVRGKRQAELRRLLVSSPQNTQEVKSGWVPLALLVLACYLFVSFNIGFFYRPSTGWPFLGEEGSHFAYIQSLLSLQPFHGAH